MDIPIP